MKYFNYLLLFVLLASTTFAQQTTPLWKEFEAAKAQNKPSILPDFFFAGYHFSERPYQMFLVINILMLPILERFLTMKFLMTKVFRKPLMLHQTMVNRRWCIFLLVNF
ncbi:MAG TPA: hypothetical protein VF273_05250 [Pelobium sp.]